MTELENKKILMVIPHDQFRDEEYEEVRKELEGAGVEVVVASSHSSTAHGRFGLKVEVDIGFREVHVSEYAAIVFIGGPGVDEYFDNYDVISIVRNAFHKRVLLAAICSAPVIFANAAIIGNKKVTAYPSRKEIISMSGAYYTDKGVEQDGEIITARGPEDAKHFGEAIVKSLKWRHDRKGHFV